MTECREPDDREPDDLGGPQAERLREQLEREFGEVPPESPTEPDRPDTRDKTDECESGDSEDDEESGGEHP